MAGLKDLKIYFRMMFSYKPKTFWNDLLTNSFDLKGVGHFRLSNEENLRMYEDKKRIITELLKNMNVSIKNDTNIIEIGIGVGYWTDYFNSIGVKDYTGNDIAQISITNLKAKYPQYNFIQGDISELMLPENTFDFGAMIDVTQHITDDIRFDSAMKNLWKSLCGTRQKMFILPISLG